MNKLANDKTKVYITFDIDLQTYDMDMDSEYSDLSAEPHYHIVYHKPCIDSQKQSTSYLATNSTQTKKPRSTAPLCESSTFSGNRSHQLFLYKLVVRSFFGKGHARKSKRSS